MNSAKTAVWLKKGILTSLLLVVLQAESQMYAGTTFAYAAGIYATNTFCSISSNGVVTPINVDQSAFAAYGSQEGMAVDTNGNLYVAYSGDAIVKFTTNTACLFGSGFGAPNLLCFDNAGDLYGNSNNCVIKITTNGSAIYASGIAGLNGFCFDQAGNLYVSTPSQASIISPGGSTNIVATIASLNPGSLVPPYIETQWYIFSIATDSQSHLHIAVDSGFPDDICYAFTVDNNGNIIGTVPCGGEDGPGNNIAVDENGNLICFELGHYSSGLEGPFGQIVFDGADINVAYIAYTPLTEVLGIYAPSIALQPNSQTVAAGSTVYFKSSSVGSLPISYQWFFNQTNVIAGATNLTLTLTNVTGNQIGQYTMLASNYLGTATSLAGDLNVLPSLGIVTVPALMLYGGVGFAYDVQCINEIGPTNSPWKTLATVTLTNSPQYYPDYSALGQPARFYRIVQVQ